MTVLVKVPGVFKSIITGRLYSLGVPSACNKINDYNLLWVYVDMYRYVLMISLKLRNITAATVNLDCSTLQ